MNPPITGSVSEEQLVGLVERLGEAVLTSGFAPELIVFIETGARMPAVLLGQRLGLPLVGISARRGGDGMKKKLLPLLARMPRWLTRVLRWLEEVSQLHRFTKRRIVLPEGLELRGRRILLLDDASDTGKTIVQVSEALLSAGLERSQMRVAVLAATTDLARKHVDFWVLDRNVRFPWSPDVQAR